MPLPQCDLYDLIEETEGKWLARCKGKHVEGRSQRSNVGLRQETLQQVLHGAMTVSGGEMLMISVQE